MKLVADREMEHTTTDADSTADGSRNLRVGVILDGIVQPQWIRHAIELINESTCANVETIVLAEEEPPASPANAGITGSQLLLRLFTRGDRRLFRRKPDPLEPTSIGTLSLGADIVVIAGTGSTIDSDSLQRIRHADLDVVLCFANVNLGRQLMTAARNGVWYYPDLFDQKGGDRPVGFGATIQGASSVETTLNELAADGSRGRTLYRSWSAVNRYSPHYTERRLLWKMATFPQRALRNLREPQWVAQQGDVGMEAVCHAHHGNDAPPPGNVAMLCAMARIGVRQMQHATRSALYRSEWSLAYRRDADFSVDLLAQPPTGDQFALIESPRDRFWADPFPVADGDTIWLFVEEFPHSAKRAHLSVMELHADGRVGAATPILTCPYHLSYPFVFQWQGDWYMVPETLENNAVDLYRSSRFPFEWTHDRRLLDGVNAVDATLLEHDEHWWMFTTIGPFGGSENDELHIFMADSPLGPWEPHRSNPQTSDVRRSRPAGRIFSSNGAWYRPAQDCSRRYGYAMTISRIMCLTETRYEEEVVTRIEPTWASGLLGTHTLNHCRGMTLVDGDRWRPRFPFLPTW